MYYDVQAEISAWLLKSQLAGGGGLLCRPQYRPQTLFC